MEYFCRARGKLRQKKNPLLVGDRVSFKPISGGTIAGACAGEGVVEEVFGRRNCLYRPPVANVDQLILVISLRDPSPDWFLADRLLALAETEGMEAILCLNKTDLVSDSELDEVKNMLVNYPYPLMFTSVPLKNGVADLKIALQKRCSVFAGPSGAGKSSLLNALHSGLCLKTGEVSVKGGRGRHTTRMAELLFLDNGGMVVDTPGFSRLDFEGLSHEGLADLFPEISFFSQHCSFRNCGHLHEPGCAVQEGVEQGKINPLRYKHYKQFYQELLDGRNCYR